MKQNKALIILLVFALGTLGFSIFSLFSSQMIVNNPTPNHFGVTTFTEYDTELAKEMMDKNNDGMCDVCGMPIEQCIASGMMQCTMDPEATIGTLDATKKTHHYHADFKAYEKGKPIDFNQEKYFVKSKFVHVENDPSGDSGEVLHIHAQGVPLWMFFESIEMNIKGKKLFVNGKETKYDQYVPKDGDKILLTSSDEDKISKELASVTDYSESHKIRNS